MSDADCASSGDLKARTADAASFRDSSGNLKETHPRFALGDFYCRMQKDSLTYATMLGAFNQAKTMFCLAGSVSYDNVERENTLTKGQLSDCVAHLGETEANALLALLEDGKTFTTKKTGFLPSSSLWPFLGKDSGWTGGVNLTVNLGTDPLEAQMLLRQDDLFLSLGVLQNGRVRKDKVDGFVLVYDKAKKSFFYDGLSQRIRSANGATTDGWNRHFKIYGTVDLDKDSKFSAVKSFQGISSFLTLNSASATPTSSAAALQSGTLATLKGSDGAGLQSKTYALTCSGSCSAANSSASWPETAGSNACSGASSGTKCSGDYLALASDSDLQFVMEGSHAAFIKAEDWFKEQKAEGQTSISFSLK